MPYSYHQLVSSLTASGISIDDARGEALLLLETFCHTSRTDILCDRNRVYDSHDLDHAVERRLSRYPLQYILGEWDFFGLTFKVNEHCLIPRPDTEILVETAIRTLPRGGVFADLCTGSGCIAVSVLKHRPDLTAVALELFPETLALATQNAEQHHVRDRFIPLCADLLTNGREALASYAPLCGILSNPPYIPKADVDALAPELFFEPLAALEGGDDGMIFYQKILSDYVDLLSPGAPILFEISYDGAEKIINLGKTYLPHASCEIVKDLEQNPRVAAFLHPAAALGIS